MTRMDIKNISTAGFKQPKKKAKVSQAEKDEKEAAYLGDETLLPYSGSQRDTTTFPTTIEWLMTWRKVVTDKVVH